MDTVHVVLATTLGADKWDIEPPLDVSCQALVRKIARTPELQLPELHESSKPIGTIERRLSGHHRRP